MNSRTDPSNPFNANIISNLREKYGEAIAKYTDGEILKTYDDWSMSDEFNQEPDTFVEWCEEWD